MSTELRAVVDCGTNSTRLWLCPDPTRPPQRLEQVTRLGRGVDANGHLDDQALAATLDVVAGYAARWHEAGVSDGEVAVIATSAVRDATDRQRFFDGVQNRTGVLPVVLTGRQEALASFAGATGAVETRGPVLVVDVGGGSTELVLGSTGVIETNESRLDIAAVSTQLGTVRLTERHLHDDPPTPHQVETARHAATSILTDGLERLGIEVPVAIPPATDLVAVAGTATTLAGLTLGSDDPRALHGHQMDAATLHDLAQRLLAASSKDRLDFGPMSPGRADVIAAGALILDVVVSLVAARTVIVSVADVLDGAAASWPLASDELP